jgi:hypothetical protein
LRTRAEARTWIRGRPSESKYWLRRAELGALNCKSVASLLAQNRDKAAAQDGGQASLFDHAKVRGPGYYH